MKIETIHEGIRYTLSNDGLLTNDKAFPVAYGRCLDNDGWILHGFEFEEYLTGFPGMPHTLIDLKHSSYKPYQVRTNYGFGPIESYYKIIKRERKVEVRPDDMFKTYKWEEISETEFVRNYNTEKV